MSQSGTRVVVETFRADYNLRYTRRRRRAKNLQPLKYAHGLPPPSLFFPLTRVQAVNRVPIFSPLSLEQKRLVSSALLEVHFRPGLYICEEVSFAMFASAPLYDKSLRKAEGAPGSEQ